MLGKAPEAFYPTDGSWAEKISANGAKRNNFGFFALKSKHCLGGAPISQKDELFQLLVDTRGLTAAFRFNYLMFMNNSRYPVLRHRISKASAEETHKHCWLGGVVSRLHC